MRGLQLALCMLAVSCASYTIAAAQEAAVTSAANLSAGVSSPHTASADESVSPALASRDARYRLCPSDVIAVTFPLTPEFDQTVNIQPDGFASLAGAGSVRLEGLTTQESVSAIRSAYAKILHDPMVTVELKDFNKPYFVVTGQVNRPGKYDLRGHTSATEAIAIAGGFTDAARHSQVLLFRRVNNDWYEVKPLNLKGILHGQNVNEDAEIRSGDMLFVPTISHLQERDPESIPIVYRESYRLVFFLAVPAFACLTVASPLLSRVWIGRYEAVFVEFVAILSAGWLVNVLSNPAYVVCLGTGTLRWISTGCIATVILNASLGFFVGRCAAAFGCGGVAVVAASAFSLAFGYIVMLVAYHLENRASFSQLLPEESGRILLASFASAFVALSAICASFFRLGVSEQQMTAAIALLLAMILVPMWLHPMRKRVLRWAFSRAPA